MVEYSVVIPTHNRLEMLVEVLHALESQVGAPQFEIVVVNDGSTDGTSEYLAGRGGRLPFRYFEVPSRGPAHARNRGVQEAKGRYIAFLGDDTVPASDWLAEHHRVRTDQGEECVAVLGHTDWHPRMESNAFLDWLNNEGKQFGYNLIADSQRVDFNFFYTSNLSVARSRLLEAPFCEDFPHAAWEDIEVGYRLIHLGDLRLVYSPEAKALHDHPTNLLKAMHRQQTVGASAVVFARLHPELQEWLRIPRERPLWRSHPWAQKLSFLLAWLLQRSNLVWVRLWEKLLDFHYAIGVAENYSDRGEMS